MAEQKRKLVFGSSSNSLIKRIISFVKFSPSAGFYMQLKCLFLFLCVHLMAGRSSHFYSKLANRLTRFSLNIYKVIQS